MYFTEVESQGPTKYVPRSVQIDLEAGVCNHVSMQVPRFLLLYHITQLYRFALVYWANCSDRTRFSQETQGQEITGQKDVSRASYPIFLSGAYVTLEIDYTEGTLTARIIILAD